MTIRDYIIAGIVGFGVLGSDIKSNYEINFVSDEVLVDMKVDRPVADGLGEFSGRAIAAVSGAAIMAFSAYMIASNTRSRKKRRADRELHNMLYGTEKRNL